MNMEIEEKVIGNHPLIRDVKRRIKRVAPTDLNVIIYGEAGTEKEITARSIHGKSLRSEGPFQSIDCNNFSDRNKRKTEDFFLDILRGAQKGTIYFDNIHILPGFLQKHLYRILSSQKQQEIITLRKPVGIRIISSLTKIDEFSENSGFNKQLINLLNQFTITIPPICDRKSDLPLLFDHYLSRAAEIRDLPEKPPVDDNLLTAIMDYNWPGNITEIRNTVSILLDLPDKNGMSENGLPFPVENNKLRFLEKHEYHEALGLVDKYLVTSALKKAGWNQTQAAKHLNMTEGNIRLKMKKYGIKKSDNL
ncbi:sigma-54-dependent transcriptional regulator [candidate division KSB1 bacterium]